jgi:hypothetical protein
MELVRERLPFRTPDAILYHYQSPTSLRPFFTSIPNLARLRSTLQIICAGPKREVQLSVLRNLK